MIYTASKAWGMKPPVGALLQFGHPLARDLDIALFFSEGAGRTFNDAVRKNGAWQPGYTVGGVTGPIGWLSTQYGYAMESKVGTYAWAHNGNYITPLVNVTILLLMRAPSANLALNGAIFGAIQNADASEAQACYALCPWSGVTYWSFGGNSGAHRVTYTPSAGFWDVWHVMAFRAGDHGMTIFEDGVIKASSATATSRTASVGFDIGEMTGGTTNYQQIVDVATFLLWKRELTDDEIRFFTV